MQPQGCNSSRPKVARPPRVILSGAIAQRLRSRNPRRKRRRAIAARSDLRGAPCSHKSCINVTKNRVFNTSSVGMVSYALMKGNS